MGLGRHPESGEEIIGSTPLEKRISKEQLNKAKNLVGREYKVTVSLSDLKG